MVKWIFTIPYLGGGFKSSLFSPLPWEIIQVLQKFFNWVETTNKLQLIQSYSSAPLYSSQRSADSFENGQILGPKWIADNAMNGHKLTNDAPQNCMYQPTQVNLHTMRFVNLQLAKWMGLVRWGLHLTGRNPIPNHRLDVKMPVNRGINYQPTNLNWGFDGFLPSTPWTILAGKPRTRWQTKPLPESWWLKQAHNPKGYLGLGRFDMYILGLYIYIYIFIFFCYVYHLGYKYDVLRTLLNE